MRMHRIRCCGFFCVSCRIGFARFSFHFNPFFFHLNRFVFGLTRFFSVFGFFLISAG